MTTVDEVVESADEPIIGEDGKPTARGWREIGKRLRQTMESKQYNAGRAGMMNYVTARQVQDRLDAVVGPGNWSTEYRVHGPHAVECRLTVFGVAKADIGYSNNPDAKPGDRDYSAEPLKGAFSDAFKRAAVAFGIGRFLYGD
jgi:hypothetical protein